uniref:PGG domain-containing protein n=1 Tax=Quercus lobata TaxID=97700 RepID=A0A7N2N6R5_QUELO
MNIFILSPLLFKQLTITRKEEKTETPILLAAKNGIKEMVVKILKDIPMAINDESNNIVLLAAKNRQTHVLRVLFKQDLVKRKLIYQVDANSNNALHLAAELGEQEPWVIPGAALQMQWEIKWYEFVKNNMPEHFRYQLNKDKMTPDEIFNRTHVDLVKQGSEWLNKTSESCSVVAALIVTVAFAASTTIPGNIDEKIGKPNLEDRSGLSIFAYSSLIALFFSTTALFSFLSILTERYKLKDFHFKLPTRLLFGLSTLFISIVSMLVSFSAGHSFMLENKLKDKTFNIYAGLTCLPIICFFLHQLPLYLDYAMANLHEVPPSSYKAITL